MTQMEQRLSQEELRSMMNSNYEKRIRELERRIAKIETSVFRPSWRGVKTSAFLFADLPKHGDYGYLTTNASVYMNIGGTIRRWATVL